ncbi:hypothetical protein H1R20_g16383, partial [Candolleomyces eurysporus]
MRIHELIRSQSLSAKKGYGRHPRLWLDVQQHENLFQAYFKDVWKSKRAIKVAADAALSVVPSLASTQKAVDSSQGDAKFAKEVLERLAGHFALYDFAASVGKLPNAQPFISINMGGEGQMSRILNTNLTPVSHPLLPNKAAPGQLSFKEIQQALHLLGLLPAKKFYLLGTPIGHSMSPTLHNTAFKLLGLPHNYELLETKDVGEEIKVAISEPDFGGASVTIPFKLDVIPLLDRLMDAAEKIGAVSTIIPETVTNADGGSGKVLVGDNTDWLGLEPALPKGFRLLISNDSKGPWAWLSERVDEEEGGGVDKTLKVVDDLEGLARETGETLNIIVSTVPASATTTASSPSPSPSNNSTAVAAGVTLPKSLFDYRDGPAVVVDMAYKPEETPLLRLAKESGSSNWVWVPGVEVSLEQGYVQFELWTGRKCPKEQLGTTVLTRYRAQA